MQTGGKDRTEDLKSDKEKTVGNSQVMAELGLKMKAPRKQKTREEIRKGYENPYKEAIAKFIDGANDTAKLNKMHCAVLLTLGFAQYTGTSSKLGELQQDLKGEI